MLEVKSRPVGSPIIGNPVIQLREWLRTEFKFHAGPILLAITLGLGMSHDNLLSLNFIAWVPLLMFSGAYVFCEHRSLSRKEAWALGIILVSMALSVVWTILWGNSYWWVTLTVVLWTGLPAFLFAVKNPERVLGWLTPFLVLHAVLVAIQGLLGGDITWGGRVTGLHMNPNPAAALLLIGIVGAICWRNRYWWVLALPFAVALPYTGSRLAVIVIAVTLVAMWVYNQRRRTVILGVLLVMAFGLQWWMNPDLIEGNFRLRTEAEETGAARHLNDAQERVFEGFTLSWRDIPGRGYIMPQEGEYHNVPLRIMAQYGILAALSWIMLCGVRVWEWRHGGIGLWLVLIIFLLSQQDYYFIMGQMAPLGWLILGWRRKLQNATGRPQDLILGGLVSAQAAGGGPRVNLGDQSVILLHAPVA